MKIWPVCLPTLAALAFAAGAVAQDGMTVSHQPPTCLSKNCGRTVLTASVTGGSAPSSVRVYFRAGNDGAEEYYLEMELVGERWEAVLPSPLPETNSVVYRIVASGTGVETGTSGPFTVQATSDCRLAPLTAKQQEMALGTVLGLTNPQQTGVPSGFSCAGIESMVGADSGQTLVSNEACRQALEDDPCFLAANDSKQAGGTGLLGAAALGVAVVGGAVIIENNKDSKPVSQSRP